MVGSSREAAGGKYKERPRPIWRKRPQGGEDSRSRGSSFLTCRGSVNISQTTHLLTHLLTCNHTVIPPVEKCRWALWALWAIISFLKKWTPPAFQNLGAGGLSASDFSLILQKIDSAQLHLPKLYTVSTPVNPNFLFWFTKTRIIIDGCWSHTNEIFLEPLFNSYEYWFIKWERAKQAHKAR